MAWSNNFGHGGPGVPILSVRGLQHAHLSCLVSLSCPTTLSCCLSPLSLGHFEHSPQSKIRPRLFEIGSTVANGSVAFGLFAPLLPPAFSSLLLIIKHERPLCRRTFIHGTVSRHRWPICEGDDETAFHMKHLASFSCKRARTSVRYGTFVQVLRYVRLSACTCNLSHYYHIL